MNNYQEESKLLFKLVRTEGFRFIIIKYNHYSLVEKIKEDLKEHFPNRKSSEIDATKTDYRNLVDSYYELESGFFFIENFDKLLENSEIYPALNQRRDKLAKYPIAMIAFISPSAPKLFARELMEKMPDLWSFRSLMLDLEKDILPQEQQAQFSDTQRDAISISSLGGNTVAKKQHEIKRLEKLLASNQNDIPLKEVILFQLLTLRKDLGEYEKSNEITNELLELTEDKEFQSGLFIDIGDNYEAMGNLNQALIEFEKSLKIRRGIGNKNREAIALQRLGKIHLKLGNLDLALETFEENLKLSKQLFEDFPEDFNYRNGLAISYEVLGEIHKECGNLNLALGYFKKFNKLMEQLSNEFSDNIILKDGLAVSYQFLGAMHQQLGQTELALSLFKKQNKLFQQLCREFPRNANFKDGLAISYQFLGNTYQKLGNSKLAIEFFNKQNKLFQQLYIEFPHNVSYKNGLAISYLKLGSWSEDNADIEQAKNYYLKAKTYYLELIEKFSEYAEFKYNLQTIENKLKELENQ